MRISIIWLITLDWCLWPLHRCGFYSMVVYNFFLACHAINIFNDVGYYDQGEELQKQIGAAYYVECSSKTQQVCHNLATCWTLWDVPCILSMITDCSAIYFLVNCSYKIKSPIGKEIEKLPHLQVYAVSVVSFSWFKVIVRFWFTSHHKCLAKLIF